MFQYFFEEYRRIYYERKKAIPTFWFSWATIVLLIIATVSYVYFVVQNQIIGALAIFAITIIILIIFYIANSKYLKRTFDDRLQVYQEKGLERLIGLLKNEKYGFVSPEQIEWLISSCKERLRMEKNPFSGFSDSFFKFVFPCVTLLIGALLNTISMDHVIVICTLVFAIWLTGFIVKDIVVELRDMFFCPNRKVLISLKTELEYIKIAPKDGIQVVVENETKVSNENIVALES